MFFERCNKKILKRFFKKTMKKQWSKGAHVAPYNMVGPSWFNEMQHLEFCL
jgi:hypothetical protein